MSQLTAGGEPDPPAQRRDKAGKLYPLTTKQSLEQFLVGAESPKTTSQGALTSLAAKEARTTMSPVQKAIADGKATLDKFEIAARNHPDSQIHEGRQTPARGTRRGEAVDAARSEPGAARDQAEDARLLPARPDRRPQPAREVGEDPAGEGDALRGRGRPVSPLATRTRCRT